MRTSSCDGGLKEIVRKIRACHLIILCSFIACFLFSACAKKPAYKHIPPKKQSVRIEHERAPETGAKKEIIRVESAPSPVMATPQARASARLIDGGRQKMTAGQFDQAERSFQEAINIDPSNGIAYYYLARARFELGQGPQALGVLDKAEELLSGSAEWSEAVQTLKGLIRESVSN